MSQLTHAQPPILGFRLGLRLWLLAAAVIACAAVSLFLVISHDDKAAVVPEPAVADTPAGMRYDGGPDEGTRGLMNAGPAPLVRYDGGPDEGGHAIRHPSAVSVPPASARYDGGPEEGTRGVPFTSATSTTAAGVRFDGGPEEGSRGLGR